jgi:hypothetical protein
MKIGNDGATPMTKTQLALYAMIKIIEYRDMYEYCMQRKGKCVGCVYFNNGQGLCTQESTIDVLSHAGDIFKDFICS